MNRKAHGAWSLTYVASLINQHFFTISAGQSKGKTNTNGKAPGTVWSERHLSFPSSWRCRWVSSPAALSRSRRDDRPANGTPCRRYHQPTRTRYTKRYTDTGQALQPNYTTPDRLPVTGITMDCVRSSQYDKAALVSLPLSIRSW